jgi:hypothetical protein
MNLGCPEMANLAYIEGDVPVLCKEPDYSLSMMYGRKVIRLPNPGL